MSKTVARNRKSIWTRAGSNKTANSPPVFSRLIGLETEYGLYLDESPTHSSEAWKAASPSWPGDSASQSDGLFESVSEESAPGTSESSSSWEKEPTGSTGSRGDWYDQIVVELAKVCPMVPSRKDARTFFMANGGSVSYETRTGDHQIRGLVEGATPECRSPLTLLSYQTAQDELFTEATHRAFGAHAAKLLKNSADAFGHSYGQQENYEVEVASGWRLLCWRMGLLCLLPAILAYKLGAALWFACVFSLAFLASFCSRVSDWRSLWDHARLGNAWVYLVIHGEPIVTQGWVDIAVRGMRLLHAPVAVGLHLLIWMFAIVPHRRYLTGFLASRIIFDGAGHYDRSGRFWLGTKAASVTSVIGFGNYWGEKPIFVTGHWLQAICTDRWNSLSGWRSLFRRKQRIQISVGDATPNTHVEYMRIGVTDLMLDLIESQCDSELPQLTSPLEAMKRFAGDWMLLHRTASVRSHSLLNAIELQRLYLQAAKRFLQRHWQVPKEAWDVLHQWQGTIDQLNECRTDPNALQWLLGRVDWVSKKWLLDQMDAKASWMIRKKVDLRFHELSEAGYQRKLQDALKLPHLNDSAEVDRARRTPPQGTPATKRGYLIREFASSDEPIRADWDAVEIGIGSAAKIVRLRKPK